MSTSSDWLYSGQADFRSYDEKKDGKFSNYLSGMTEEDYQKNSSATSNITKVLLFGIAFTGACVLLFTPDIPTNVLGDKNPGKPHPDDPIDPDEDKAFAVSGGHFHDVHSTLGNLGLADGWSGNSGTLHGDRHIGFTALVTQAADMSEDVDATVATQAEQVSAGKTNLENILSGLQLALPVAESLYFSGPAGPAISHHYQLAVANSAVETSTDTTETMHENAQMHARELTELAQQYDQALLAVPAINTATAPRLN
ncbi:MAG: hypothetical protein K2Q25_06390 [Mycobacteriaceae bacterium]|nr:hypothetical protein [Mycobacteriaceae bacterium]